MENNERSLKEVIKNLALSFFSFALPTVILQFVVQPILAAKLGAELNGQYLTLSALNFFVIGITASVLNTVRMLQHSKYQERGFCGDFNLFLLLDAAIIIALYPTGFLFYTKAFDLVDVLLYVAVGLLYLYHDYIFAQYRLGLQYNKILINNIILVIGYALGTLIFACWIPKWQIVFIVPYCLSGIYDYSNTTFIKEPLKKTPYFGDTGRQVALLTLSTALGTAAVYCDKLLLYPLLDGVSVSIYSTAALVGKILLMVSSPLQSVLLSYLVKMQDINIKLNKKLVLIGAGAIVFGYVGCVVIGYPLTDFLYPAWSKKSQVFIPITVAASVIGLVNGLLNTVIIRFCKTIVQVVIQSVDLVVYLALTLIFLHFFALPGYCVGVLLAGFIKMILMIVILKNRNKLMGKQNLSKES